MPKTGVVNSFTHSAAPPRWLHSEVPLAARGRDRANTGRACRRANGRYHSF